MISRITTNIRSLWTSVRSRSRSAAKTSAASLQRWDSAESLEKRFSDVSKKAQASAYLKAFVFNSRTPSRDAKVAAKDAVSAEHAKVQDLIALRGKAERAHIKAKHQLSIAQLKLHQTQRQFGSYSLLTHQARKAKAEAVRTLGVASADLYLAQIATP